MQYIVTFKRFVGLSNINWSIFRRSFRRGRISFEDFDNPDDALAAASKLDRNGDWDASINVYRLTGERSPEHGDYIESCIARIVEKETLGQW